MANYTQPLLDYLEAQLAEVDRRQVIGSQIRAARVSSGTSQNDLADFIGVSQSYLANVEAGRKWPSTSTMVSIVNYFSQGGEHGEDQDEDLA